MKFMNFSQTLIAFKVFVVFHIFSSIALANGSLCGNENLDLIIDKDPRNMEYNENRNDHGIHFLYEWDGKDKIIIKRNKNKYPIVRYSLFDNKNFIPNKTVIKKIDNTDLSKLSDNKLDKYTYLEGKINFGHHLTEMPLLQKQRKYNGF